MIIIIHMITVTAITIVIMTMDIFSACSKLSSFFIAQIYHEGNEGNESNECHENSSGAEETRPWLL